MSYARMFNHIVATRFCGMTVSQYPAIADSDVLGGWYSQAP